MIKGASCLKRPTSIRELALAQMFDLGVRGFTRQSILWISDSKREGHHSKGWLFGPIDYDMSSDAPSSSSFEKSLRRTPVHLYGHMVHLLRDNFKIILLNVKRYLMYY
jgi:hypothetical protein